MYLSNQVGNDDESGRVNNSNTSINTANEGFRVHDSTKELGANQISVTRTYLALMGRSP